VTGRYLLDADTMIDAKNRLYAFDLCPGFWDFLEHEQSAGALRSIHRVKIQLEAGGDELGRWAHARSTDFFMPDTPEMLSAMPRVANWVQAHPTYSDTAKRDFLADTDAFLIAYALAHGDTVVTNEAAAPLSVKRVKIPDLCVGVGVDCIQLANALRRRGALFIWSRLPGATAATAPARVAQQAPAESEGPVQLSLDA
jgi:Domain of unknown function (DUF4411)